jgi:hypothetical protein
VLANFYFRLFHLIDLDTDFDCELFRLLDLETPVLITDIFVEMGLTADVTGRQGFFLGT